MCGSLGIRCEIVSKDWVISDFISCDWDPVHIRSVICRFRIIPDTVLMWVIISPLAAHTTTLFCDGNTRAISLPHLH